MNRPVQNGSHAQQIQPANGAGELAEVLVDNDKAGLRFKALSAFALGKPPQKKKMKHGWMPERRTASISSAGGLLKSTFITDQAVKVASSGELAVIVSAEDEAEDYFAKFYSAVMTPGSRRYGLDIADIASRILIVDVSGAIRGT